jgi:hypothetical protein
VQAEFLTRHSVRRPRRERNRLETIEDKERVNENGERERDKEVLNQGLDKRYYRGLRKFKLIVQSLNASILDFSALIIIYKLI